MDQNLHRNMIALSNNSTLTGQATSILTKAFESLSSGEKIVITHWLEHAKKEQQIKIDNAKRKFR